MKQKLLLLCLLVLAVSSIAQKRPVNYKFFLSGSPDLLIPNAEFSETHKIGYGATATVGYKINNHFSPIVSLHYYSVPTKNKTVNESLTAMLVKAGSRMYFDNFYVYADGGLIFTSGYDNATRFVYGIGAGDEIRLNSRSRLDISGAYEGFNTGRNNGIIAARVGFTYLLGK